MRPKLRWLAVGMVAALAFAACGGDDDDDDTAANVTTTIAAETDETTASASDATTTTLAGEAGTQETATLGLGETSLGPTLIDAEGYTVYVFDQDSNGTSVCNEGCSDLWPAVTVTGEPVIGDDLDEEDVGTITRGDGTTQVTWYGMPVYRFSGDTQPGDTMGTGIGGVWWPIGPDGTKLSAAVEQSSTGGDGY